MQVFNYLIKFHKVQVWKFQTLEQTFCFFSTLNFHLQILNLMQERIVSGFRLPIWAPAKCRFKKTWSRIILPMEELYFYFIFFADRYMHKPYLFDAVNI